MSSSLLQFDEAAAIERLMRFLSVEGVTGQEKAIGEEVAPTPPAIQAEDQALLLELKRAAAGQARHQAGMRGVCLRRDEWNKASRDHWNYSILLHNGAC